MSNLVLGVMIQSLGGNAETVAALKSALGKTIKTVKLEDNNLVFNFTDGTGLEMFDYVECSENRYMVTDDDLSEYKNSKLLDFELKTAPNVPGYGDHEIRFLEVKTDKGVFVMANHNEHNGHYGGFLPVARLF